MQQIFVNTGAPYEEADDDMEFQEVSVSKKMKSMPSDAVQRHQICRT